MKHLYRYRKFNDNTLKEILNGELYFSLPIELNDPFDCMPIVECEGTVEEYRELYKDIQKKYHYNNLSDEEIDKRVQEEFDESKIINKKVLSDFINQSILQSRNQVYVCCFSENNNNTLMYTHYSDNHTGVCLEYSLKALSTQFEIIDQLNYEIERPIIRFIDGFKMGEKEYSKRFLLTKSKPWEYEKEHRIIAFPVLTDEGKLLDSVIPVSSEHRIIKLQPKTLTGLILGYKISDEQEALLIDKIRAEHLDVNIYKARPSKLDFKMEINQID